MMDIGQIRSRRRLYLCMALMVVSALLFYVMQNRGMLVGGEIALAKMLWLFFAILYWFVLPLLIVLDRGSSAAMRRLYLVFLVNMCARALIELYMMYISLNWHPWYGIGHDAFSILLILVLALRQPAQNRVDIALRSNLWVIVAMFALEIGFAWYLLQSLGGGTQPVYFVPSGPGHVGVLAITWVAVVALGGYLVVLVRGWLYASAVR